MAAELHWHNHETVIVEFSSSLTWDEFHAAVREAHVMIGSVNHPVHLVIIQGCALPPGYPLHHFQIVVKEQPRNTATVFIIPKTFSPAVGSFMKALMSIVERANPNKSRMRMVTSLEEAMQHIARNQAGQAR
jgi:hypothetical protein